MLTFVIYFAGDNTSKLYLPDMISVLGYLKGGIDRIFYCFTKNFLE